MTDANVVLGHLPPRLLGGEMELDVEAARAAVQTIADAMGLPSVEAAAEGILAIVNENMAGALRLVSVQRGHDPRDFALVAYGGAGPLHANAVAKLMGSFPVLVPPAPGLLCAIGDLVADFRDEFARRTSASSPRPIRREVCEILDELGERAVAWLDDEGIPAEARTVSFAADMRYRGQGYEIPVAIDPEDVRANGLADLDERFNGLHEQLYGFRMHGHADRDRQPARDRLRRSAEARAAGRRARRRGRVGRGRRGARDRVRGRARADEDLRPRGSRPGMRFEGPAIVTEFDSTTVVLPGYEAAIDLGFNIQINPKA